MRGTKRKPSQPKGSRFPKKQEKQGPKSKKKGALDPFRQGLIEKYLKGGKPLPFGAFPVGRRGGRKGKTLDKNFLGRPGTVLPRASKIGEIGFKLRGGEAARKRGHFRKVGADL